MKLLNSFGILKTIKLDVVINSVLIENTETKKKMPLKFRFH